MLKILFVFGAAAAFLLALESHREGQLQVRRTAEQAELLAGLAALCRPAISQLVADWQMLYPAPNEDRLRELRDIAMQLRADPESLAAPAQSVSALLGGAPARSVESAP